MMSDTGLWMTWARALTQSVATKNRLVCGKLISRQFFTVPDLTPTKNLQFYDKKKQKKTASVRQPYQMVAGEGEIIADQQY